MSKISKLEEYIIKNEIIRIAINLEYNRKYQISNNDEIALFPPVSGG